MLRFPRLARILASIAVTLVIPVPGLASTATAASVRPAICNTSFDPYKVSTAVVRSCGLRMFSRQRVTRLADGGTEYVYNVDGDRYVYRIPRAGLDLSQASSNTLAFYGLPQRPAEHGRQTEWAGMMKHLHLVTPPEVLVETHAPTDG